MSVNRKFFIFLLSCSDMQPWWWECVECSIEGHEQQLLASLCSCSILHVGFGWFAGWFLVIPLLLPPPSPLAIHIAACPSHIHWPCPGSALLVFGPVLVERYIPTWHQTAALCLSFRSASICPSSVEGRPVEMKGASGNVTSPGSQGHDQLLNPNLYTDACDMIGNNKGRL